MEIKKKEMHRVEKVQHSSCLDVVVTTSENMRERGRNLQQIVKGKFRVMKVSIGLHLTNE